VANVLLGKTFASTGDASLPLYLLGEEFTEDRPRLILATSTLC
jgi:hypothetical protein